jgi:hypothetical protein
MKRSTASTACSFGLAISAKHGMSFNGGLLDDRVVRRDAIATRHSGLAATINAAISVGVRLVAH